MRIKEFMNGGYRALDNLRASGAVKAIGAGINEWDIAEKLARAGDFDTFLLAGRYTLLEQEALTTFLPLCAEKNIAVVVGGPFNSGILATGVKADAHYNYGQAPQEIRERVRRIQHICKSFKVRLPEAALRFPLGHPSVVSVIAGAQRASEVRRNAAMMKAKLACRAPASPESGKIAARGCAHAALSVVRPFQKRPSISPLTTRIRSAAGLRGRPGMVRTSPINTTTKPAPARRRMSLIFGTCPTGAPSN